MAKLRASLLVVSLALVIFTSQAIADGSSDNSCTFSGCVRLDGSQALGGTLITAVIEGDEYNTYTSTGALFAVYSITIGTPEGKNYPEGTKVTFKIDGHTASQTASFKAGTNTWLDLTASTSSALASSSVAIISGVFLALLAVGATAFYLLLRRRGLRIADWLVGKGSVAAVQAPPLVVEDQVQPVSKYIWDNTKLAWVENTRPAEIMPPVRSSVVRSVRSSVPVVAGAGVGHKVKQDTSTIVDSKDKAVIEKQTITTVEKRTADDPEMLALYHGDVRLLVATSLTRGPLPTFATHLGQLRRTYQLRVLEIEAVSRQSARFELWLQRPLPLLRILKTLPEVDTVSRSLKGSRDASPVTHTAGSLNAKIVEVKLKDVDSYPVTNSKSGLNTKIIEVELK